MNQNQSLLFFFPLIFIFHSSTATSLTYQHPLDPLTPSELNIIGAIVKKSYPAKLAFQYIGLEEPDKPTLLSWLSSNLNKPQIPPSPRRAFVIARFNKQTLEIIIDLSKRTIVSTKAHKGHGFPMYTFEEQNFVNELPHKYEPFIQSVNKRGLNVSKVVCGSFTVGWFGEVKSKRRTKLQCYYADEEESANLYVRPVEGITLDVDLDERKIVGYIDRVNVPVPKAEGTEYRSSKQKPPFVPDFNGVIIEQPDGPTFNIRGHSIRILVPLLQ